MHVQRRVWMIAECSPQTAGQNAAQVGGSGSRCLDIDADSVRGLDGGRRRARLRWGCGTRAVDDARRRLPRDAMQRDGSGRGGAFLAGPGPCCSVDRGGAPERGASCFLGRFLFSWAPPSPFYENIPVSGTEELKGKRQKGARGGERREPRIKNQETRKRGKIQE
ncbi:hypothetical protein B0H17DRAFT_308928 [Mycena rosella]|uniref:Uncharacterized protein n=1 Tax=Mycena rosella TaxID=1033263 RepID=A0AAD7G3H0_MYCRO|nr:hypothetical protein B0H17DRAFT_308928 [Mycena rosella]